MYKHYFGFNLVFRSSRVDSKNSFKTQEVLTILRDSLTLYKGQPKISFTLFISQTPKHSQFFLYLKTSLPSNHNINKSTWSHLWFTLDNHQTWTHHQRYINGLCLNRWIFPCFFPMVWNWTFIWSNGQSYVFCF